MDHELLWGTAATALFVAAWFFPLWNGWIGSPCLFRMLTDHPCPLCGGTRALWALTHGHVAAAWRFNPLATVVGIFAMLYALYAWGALLSGRRWRPPPHLRAARLWLIRLAVGMALTANWWYLIQWGNS